MYATHYPVQACTTTRPILRPRALTALYITVYTYDGRVETFRKAWQLADLYTVCTVTTVL